MDRYGLLWSWTVSALLVRGGLLAVNRWYIADPAHPERRAEVAYPAAGTPNAELSLLLARLDGTPVPVDTTGRVPLPGHRLLAGRP